MLCSGPPCFGQVKLLHDGVARLFVIEGCGCHLIENLERLVVDEEHLVAPSDLLDFALMQRNHRLDRNGEVFERSQVETIFRH